MNSTSLKFPFLFRFIGRYVRNSKRQISSSSFCFVRQQNSFARREMDFLQPTSKIASPLAVCVLKNYFVSFGFVEQTDIGRAIQVVEYYLNGDISARLIFTVAELRKLYDSVKTLQSALAEGQQAFSSIKKSVDKTILQIWEDIECGLRVLRISHSTPLYNNLRPLVVPIFNLEDFLKQLDTVLMSSE